MKRRLWAVLALAFSLAAPHAWAEVPLEGQFIARKVCPATQNIAAGDNPGRVMTRIDRAYPLIAMNRAEGASHYLIAIDGPEPRWRWVAIVCGDQLAPAGGPDTRANVDGPRPASGAGEPVREYLLAVSWQPAFCQLNRAKPECRSQQAARFDATHLSLHGLWPQPYGTFYCGIPAGQKQLDEAGLYRDLKALDLSPATRTRLERVMPGTRSFLQRHEWTKHGSCFGEGGPEDYYRASLALMETLNASPVRDLLAANIGEEISAREIRRAFDTAFGEGAGSRVAIICKAGLITELRIALGGKLEEETGEGASAAFADLIHAAHPPSAAESSCRIGRVDAAGF